VDTAARFGGDEFALVLPETTGADAARVASRVRHDLACDGEQPPLSVSVGLAAYPQDGTTPEDLLRRADRLLYAAKPRAAAAQAQGA